MSDVDPYTVMHENGTSAELLNDAAAIFTDLAERINLPPIDVRKILNWMTEFERLADNVTVPHETQEDPRDPRDF